MILLNSDTETKPTDAMRAAMAEAAVGNEQHGEDPTVNALQDRVAALLGAEAGLWLPTGTMCNLIAVKAHTVPGQVILLEAAAHILRAESGGAAVASGVQAEPIATDRGIFTPADIDAAVARVAAVPPPHGPPPGLICVEQTHNLGGGTVWTVAQLQAVQATARTLGVPVHMDGARLLNAAAALGVPASALATAADTAWIDFTKGLGAPIGAVLAGSRAFIDRARRWKHAFGGAMRQAGIAAAGCLYALDHHVDRLADDHAAARRLAAGLAGITGIRLLTAEPQTNMVFFDTTATGLSNGAFTDAMATHGVKLGVTGGAIRAVTHLDITAADIDTTLAAAATVVRTAPGPSARSFAKPGERAISSG